MLKEKLAAMNRNGFGVVYDISDTINRGTYNYINDATGSNGILERNVQQTATIAGHTVVVTLATEKETGFQFVHVRIQGVKDNTLPDAAKLKEMMPEIQEMVDNITNGLPANAKLRADAKKAVFHCNGGLGRGPSFMVAYKLNEAVKYANEKNLGLVANWKNQKELIIDGKLNLACVYRNLLIRGTYARSTFVQSEDQFNSLYKLVNELAEERNIVEMSPEGVSAQGNADSAAEEHADDEGKAVHETPQPELATTVKWVKATPSGSTDSKQTP